MYIISTKVYKGVFARPGLTFPYRINVRDFGAVGDGVTDDSEAIRYAFAYAKRYGVAEVFVPPGTYYTGYQGGE